MEYNDIIAVLESVKRREIRHNDNINKLCTSPGESIGAKAIDAAIEKLNDYRDAEEQGRLVVLPCAVGADIYILENKSLCCYDKTKVEKFFFQRNSVYFNAKCTVDDWGNAIWDLPISTFGKTVLLTREAAEAALRERQGE